MRLFALTSYSGSAANTNINEFDGLSTQANPAITFNSKGNSLTGLHFYFEDPDGVPRRAMGAYADTSLTDNSTSSLAQPIATSPNRIGIATATAYTFDDTAKGVPTQQTQSRPIILNRPFRSVSEMSYTFTGTPWKNIDFFTPESGYVGLLDVFCVGDPPPNGLVAGKVDLNTRQAPVIQSLVAGASRDEWYGAPAAPGYALPPINSTEAQNVAAKLIQYTTDNPKGSSNSIYKTPSSVDVWRGPLGNISELVGRYISPITAPMPTSPPPALLSSDAGQAPDWYSYVTPTPLVAGQTANPTYAGFTGLLDATVYTETTSSANLVSPVIQRFRESALRPLIDGGQTRVWNLLIDVVAQTGHYPNNSNITGLNQFVVEGEKRVWLHVAIDRYTGQVLDKQVEVVAP